MDMTDEIATGSAIVLQLARSLATGPGPAAAAIALALGRLADLYGLDIEDVIKVVRAGARTSHQITDEARSHVGGR